jgi:hypothetical protein
VLDANPLTHEWRRERRAVARGEDVWVRGPQKLIGDDATNLVVHRETRRLSDVHIGHDATGDPVSGGSAGRSA